MSKKEEELASLRREQRLVSHSRLSDDARERLKKIATKKFRTCFIAALDEFEKAFGLELWGHNLPEDQITSEQKISKKLWIRVRQNILNKGNTQSRALGMEIDLHRIEFEGYRMDFGGIIDG